MVTGTAFFLPFHSGSSFQIEICNLDTSKSSFPATSKKREKMKKKKKMSYKVLSTHGRCTLATYSPCYSDIIHKANYEDILSQ